jgi:hypothetical protein
MDMSVVTLAVVNDAEIVVQICRESFDDLAGKAVVQAVSADVGRIGVSPVCVLSMIGICHG